MQWTSAAVSDALMRTAQFGLDHQQIAEAVLRRCGFGASFPSPRRLARALDIEIERLSERCPTPVLVDGMLVLHRAVKDTRKEGLLILAGIAEILLRPYEGVTRVDVWRLMAELAAPRRAFAGRTCDEVIVAQACVEVWFLRLRCWQVRGLQLVR